MKRSAMILVSALMASYPAHAKPLKVFNLAGQSNMKGPASVATFDYIGDDRSTAPLLKLMRAADGKPSVSNQTSHLIRDVRMNLAAPNLPFVIGVMGVGGLTDKSEGMTAFRNAMAAPASMPEFTGTVATVQTAPFWSDELGTIAGKHNKVNQMRHFLDSKHKDHPNADGHMTDEEKAAYLKTYDANLISPAEVALWKRGASNAGYHYLGCAKTFALMGKAFAQASLDLQKQPKAQ